MKISAGDLGQRLCKVWGLDASQVRAIRIELGPNDLGDPAVAEIEWYVEDGNEAGELTKYHLVPVEDES